MLCSAMFKVHDTGFKMITCRHGKLSAYARCGDMDEAGSKQCYYLRLDTSSTRNSVRGTKNVGEHAWPIVWLPTATSPCWDLGGRTQSEGHQGTWISTNRIA